MIADKVLKEFREVQDTVYQLAEQELCREREEYKNSPPEQTENTVTDDAIQLEIVKILKIVTSEMKSPK